MLLKYTSDGMAFVSKDNLISLIDDGMWLCPYALMDDSWSTDSSFLYASNRFERARIRWQTRIDPFFTFDWMDFILTKLTIDSCWSINRSGNQLVQSE